MGDPRDKAAARASGDWSRQVVKRVVRPEGQPLTDVQWNAEKQVCRASQSEAPPGLPISRGGPQARRGTAGGTVTGRLTR